MEAINSKISIESNLFLSSDLFLPTSEPNKIVFLLHGFSSGKDNKTNKRLIPKLLDHNCLVITFNFKGHYDSDGNISNTCISSGIEDFLAVYNFYNSKYSELFAGLELVVFASSFGGTVALGVYDEVNATKLVLKSPVIDIQYMEKKTKGLIGILLWKIRGKIEIKGSDGITILNYIFYSDAGKYNFYKKVLNNKIPIFIVQGTGDKTSPIEQSKKLKNLLPENVSLKELEDADHRLSNPEDFNKAINFIINSIIK